MTTNYNGLLAQIGAVFVIGDRVRHVTQEDAKPGVVTSVTIVPGSLRYGVVFDPADGELWCAAIELEPAEDGQWD